jgi:hypothetical protein
MKTLLIAAIVAATLAGTAARSTAAPTAIHTCGKPRIAGHRWSVGAANLTCPRAIALVRQLVTHRRPNTSPLYPRRYFGMRCIGGTKKGTYAVECIGAKPPRFVGAKEL